MDINIKGVDKEAAEKVTEVARSLGFKSRLEYLSTVFAQIASGNFINLLLPESTMRTIRSRVKVGYRQKRGIEAVIEQDIKRYYCLLERVGYSFKPFNYDEAMALADAFNGTDNTFDIDPISILQMNVHDYLEYQPEGHLQLKDGKEALAKKIKNLDRLEAAFVVDAIERFWNSEFDYRDEEKVLDDLVRVGLTTHASEVEYHEKTLIGVSESQEKYNSEIASIFNNCDLSNSDRTVWDEIDWMSFVYSGDKYNFSNWSGESFVTKDLGSLQWSEDLKLWVEIKLSEEELEKYLVR